MNTVNSSSITILVADDHRVIREGIISILKDEQDIEVVGQAIDGEDATQKVKELQPNIVLMDIRMPILNGLEATRKITGSGATPSIIILTEFGENEYVHEAFSGGAKGYVMKSEVSNDLLPAIRAVFRGEQFVSPAIASGNE